AGVADFRIHDLRHTGATRTLRASKNLRAVKEMLGHADIKTTMRYAHVLVDDVAEAMTARVIDEAARRAAHESRMKSRENPEQSSEGGHKQPKQKEKKTYVKEFPKLYVEGSIPFSRANSLRRHHFSPASSNTTPPSVIICEAGGRSYAAAENRLPVGHVLDPDLCGFWAGSRRCVIRESYEAMSNESVSCGIFKSNQDQRRGYRAASGIQWKPCRPGRTNSLFWTLGSGERPGNRRQRFCETDPMASGFRILGKTQ